MFMIKIYLNIILFKLFCKPSFSYSELTWCYPESDLSVFILCIIKRGMLFMKGSHGADHWGEASFLFATCSNLSSDIHGI